MNIEENYFGGPTSVLDVCEDLEWHQRMANRGCTELIVNNTKYFKMSCFSLCFVSFVLTLSGLAFFPTFLEGALADLLLPTS